MLIFQYGNSAYHQSGSEEEQVAAGRVIMEKVFNRFHINYEMSRLHKVGYYKESVSDTNSTYYLAEGIVDIYIPSNLNRVSNASISPIRTRKKAFHEVDKTKLLLGNASDMARSSIWRPNSFLDEKHRGYYSFSYAGDTEINGFDVSVIEFRPVKSGGQASGKIYVDKTYLAIVRIEYTPLAENSKIWKSISWTEDFDFNHGAYELTSVEFNGISLDDFHYSALLVMNQIETVSQIPSQDFIYENTPLFETATEESMQDFWEGYEELRLKIAKQNVLVAAE